LWIPSKEGIGGEREGDYVDTVLKKTHIFKFSFFYSKNSKRFIPQKISVMLSNKPP
jgi:hypothetical protein